jgi:hypothetical protein
MNFYSFFVEVFTILANSERGSSEICKAEITHGGFGSEFWPVSTLEFHGHPNSGIQASKFQMGNSKPQFIHPNRQCDCKGKGKSQKSLTKKC